MSPDSQLPSPGHWSRRAFLHLAGVAGAAGAGAVVAACGGDDDESEDEKTTTSEEAAKGDVTILNAALDLEHTAVAAYAAGGRLLSGELRARSRQLLAQEREHVDALAQTIEQIGGTPNAARSDSDYRRGFPRLRNPDDILRFLLDIENTAVAAYVGAVAKLAGPTVRQTVAAINANEAEHISVLLGALGRPRVPDAFVTGKPS